MDVMKLAGLAICAALLLTLLRQMKPEIASAAAIAAGTGILVMILPLVQSIMSDISALAEQGGVKTGYVTQLLKITGISLLMDFSAQTCRDAGESGLAMKTELAGRVMLLALALPAMQALLRQILSLSV